MNASDRAVAIMLGFLLGFIACGVFVHYVDISIDLGYGKSRALVDGGAR